MVNLGVTLVLGVIQFDAGSAAAVDVGVADFADAGVVVVVIPGTGSATLTLSFSFAPPLPPPISVAGEPLEPFESAPTIGDVVVVVDVVADDVGTILASALEMIAVDEEDEEDEEPKVVEPTVVEEGRNEVTEGIARGTNGVGCCEADEGAGRRVGLPEEEDVDGIADGATAAAAAMKEGG